MDRKPHYAIQEHQDALWLFVDGTPTADLEEMRLIDFGSFISVEGVVSENGKNSTLRRATAFT